MNAALLTVILTTFSATDPAVDRDTLWVDIVKRGDLSAAVTASGRLASHDTVLVEVPLRQARRIHPGNAASVNTHAGILAGRVKVVGTEPRGGRVQVTLETFGRLPSTARTGDNVDTTVEVAMLRDVVWVGRPLEAEADTKGKLFRVDPGGATATQVVVEFGLASKDKIEVRSGLRPGDRVILSDMRSHAGDRTVQLH